jgi:hypothetical protein
MNHITEITEELIAVFRELRAGTIKREDAAEINNTAGKIMGTMKLRLAYHALRNEAPDIAYLAGPTNIVAVEQKPTVTLATERAA